MRLEHFEYLIEIAKTNSMSLAAKHLCISHQGISGAISSLEQELGVKLLNRTHNGVYLTEDGKRYVEFASTILNELNTMKSETSNPKKNQPVSFTGSFTVYAAPFFCSDILPATILEFKTLYPAIKITSKKMGSHEIIKLISEEEADLGLITLVNNDMKTTIENLTINNNIKINKLFFTKLFILTEKSSAIAGRKSISIHELLHYPLAINYDFMNIFSYLDTASEFFGKPIIAIETDSFQTSLLTTAQGTTNCFITEYSYNVVRNTLPPNIVAIPVNDIKYFVGWIINNKNKLLKTPKLFIDILKNSLQ